MVIKVCGMKYPDNISELNRLPVDLMGLIFYEKSPRYVDNLKPDSYSKEKKRVGVFVNADKDYILEKAKEYNLSFIQLHGDESPDFCRELNEVVPVIKAFSIANGADFGHAERYEGLCRYFLFDTKTPQYGGSGQKFDWGILSEYKGATPFLLSGGISVDDAEAVKGIRHPRFAGVDLNSRFEVQPGLKDIQLLQQFIKALRL